MDNNFLAYTKRRIDLCLSCSSVVSDDGTYAVFSFIDRTDVEEIRSKLLQLFAFIESTRKDWVYRQGREICIKLLTTELLTPYYSKFATSRTKSVVEAEDGLWLEFDDNNQRLVGLCDGKLIFIANGIARQSEVSIQTFMRKSNYEFESNEKLLNDAFDMVVLAQEGSQLYYMKHQLLWDK